MIKLPETVSDPTELIAATCPIRRDNVMVVSGRGGLAENPRSHLRGQSVWQDLRLAIPGLQTTTTNAETLTNQRNQGIVEAKSWMINSQGNVELLTHVASVSNWNFWYQPAKCQEL